MVSFCRSAECVSQIAMAKQIVLVPAYIFHNEAT